MANAAFVTSEETPQNPLLIIDKAGYVSGALLPSLAAEFFCVNVSGKEAPVSEQILAIPFGRHIPLLPDSRYSHIIFVYKGEKNERLILSQVLRKALVDGAVCVFVASIYTVNKRVIDMIQTENPKTRILLYADVFSDTILARNSINRLLHQAWTENRVILPNDGLSPTRPVAFSDIIATILAAAFTKGSFHKISLLFPKYPLSQLSIARILSQPSPQLRIDFVKTKRLPDPPSYIPSEGVYVLEPYDVAAKLRFAAASPRELVQKKSPFFSMHPQQKRSKKWFLLLLLIFFSLPFSVPLSLSASGVALLALSKQALLKEQLSQARTYAAFSQTAFTKASVLASASAEKIPLTFLQRPLFQIARLSEQGSTLSTLLVDASDVSLAVRQAFFAAKPASLPQAEVAIRKLRQLILELRSLKTEGSLPSEVASLLQSHEQEIDLFLALSDSITDLSGFTKPKTYLVLFQNSFELRPGGGFIGSYGIAQIDHGKLLTLTIHDVYDADGKLKGHLEPPFALRRYLGSSNWFLRDSNYALDFRTNAVQAASFLELETGERVDGVIGIDTQFLQSLLRITGPLWLPEYKTSVTADTVFLTFEKASQENFFPGSTQKRDFLSSVYSLIRDHFQEGKIPPSVFAKEMTKALAEKHLQLVVNNSLVQQVLTVNRLSGALIDPRAPEENTVLDTFGVNETNVGQNKANYYLTRSIDHAVRIRESGEVVSSVRLSYKNKSTSHSAFGGDYKTYIRLLVPKGAKLQEITIDGEEENIVPAVTDAAVFRKKTFAVPQGFEVEQSEEGGRQLFGFLVTIPMSSQKTIEVAYRLPTALSLAKPSFRYSLQVVKQPGTNADPYRFSLSFPSGFHPLKSSEKTEVVGNRVNYSTTLAEDREFTLLFSQ